MNTDLALLAVTVVGALIGFALGYSKGFEHCKISGRISRGKLDRQLEQVGR